MAAVTNAFLTFDSANKREDLVDVIYRVEREETPFISMIERVPAKAVTHEWQTQALASASTTNQQLEGAATSRAAATATVRVTNTCEIAEANATVSGTQAAVLKAGVSDEMDYQLILKGLELRRDMESSLCENKIAVTGGTTTARVARSLETWYETNANFQTTTTLTTGANGSSTVTRTDGTQRTLTEAMLKDVIKQCWDSGGRPTTVMVGSFNKQLISEFSGRSTQQQNTDQMAILAAADLYISNFGRFKIVPNAHQRARTAHVLQDSMWALATLRDFSTGELGRVGDAMTQDIISEFTLEGRNEKSSGIVADLNTAAT